MDGSNRSVLVLDALGRPRAIAVDNPIGQEEGEGRVYWTDNLYQRIESVSLNGSHRRVEIGGCCLAVRNACLLFRIMVRLRSCKFLRCT